MNTRIKDMTRGAPLSLIFTFALPLMVGNIFQQMYTVVDTMVVGKALGVDALAALGATDWFYWMILGAIQGLTQGFGILMSKEFGAKDYEKLRRAVGSSTVLAALCALVFLFVCQLLARPVLNLLNTPASIIRASLLYLRILIFGLPIVMFYNHLACILRSLGDGQTPLAAMILASVFNIVLDLVFVLLFGWGIAGAAAATLIAQLSASVFCLYRLLKIDLLRLNAKHFVLHAKSAVKLLSLGFPMAGQNAVIGIGGMIIQFVVNGYGVSFIAGFTAANKICGMLEIAAISYGYAMITYTGQNLGARCFSRIRLGLRKGLLVALGTSFVISLLMIFFGHPFISLFISGTPRQIAEAVGVGYTYLLIMSICLPSLYVLHVVRSTIQGMGNTLLPMVSGLAEFCMRTGAVLLLPPLIGEYGIYFAEVLAWFGADLILVPSYFFVIRKVSGEAQ